MAKTRKASPPGQPGVIQDAELQKSKLAANDSMNILSESDDEPTQVSHRKRRPKSLICPPLTLEERTTSPWKVGAHVSAAGGVQNAVTAAAAIGANAFSLFLKSQRKWDSKPFEKETIKVFKERMVQYGYDPKYVLPHGNYLVNLGNPEKAKRDQSFACFLDELERCEQLGLKYFNFHPGSTLKKIKPEESIAHIAECINRAHKKTESVVTVLENMAGSGNVVGGTFEEIAQIIELVEDKTRVGVCLDTCHMFAAGYDIRTKEAWNKTMNEFEDVIGLKYLCGMHLNDSKHHLRSKKDRHENIGLGHIGMTGFLQILTDPRVQDVPLILETPSFEQPAKVWRKEIEVLNKLSLCSSSSSSLVSASTPSSTSGVVEEAGTQTTQPHANAQGHAQVHLPTENQLKVWTQDVKDAVELGRLSEKEKEVTREEAGVVRKMKRTAEAAAARKKRKREEEEEGSEGEDGVEGVEGSGEGEGEVPPPPKKSKAAGKKTRKGRKGVEGDDVDVHAGEGGGGPAPARPRRGRKAKAAVAAKGGDESDADMEG